MSSFCRFLYIGGGDSCIERCIRFYSIILSSPLSIELESAKLLSGSSDTSFSIIDSPNPTISPGLVNKPLTWASGGLGGATDSS